MKRILSSFTFFSFIAFCFLSSSSFAFMKGLSTEELTMASDLIIEGDIENVEAQWSKDGKTIFTSAEILISTVIRGNTIHKKLTVEYTGGEVGEIGLKVSDQITFRKGEKVLLFLKSGMSKKDGTAYNVVGKGQGKYIINSEGIAQKNGFSVAGEKGMIDNNIPATTLMEKIRGVAQ
jgi:hypothetical protein